MTTCGLDCLGATEALKPLAGHAGMYGEVYGCGIKDGRGYGPYGAGYTNVDGVPYGPNGEILSKEYDFQPPLERRSIKWRPPRKILPGFGATEIGIEGTDIAKMFGNLMSGTGGILSAGSGKKGDDSQAAAERKRLEEDKRKAEQSASTMKTALIAGGVAVAAVGGAYLLKTRKK